MTRSHISWTSHHHIDKACPQNIPLKTECWEYFWPLCEPLEIEQENSKLYLIENDIIKHRHFEIYLLESNNINEYV